MRSDKLGTPSQAVGENYAHSHLSATRVSHVNTAIIIIPYPNPFRNSLRSSQNGENVKAVHEGNVLELTMLDVMGGERGEDEGG